jgi:hypothetical protein
LAFLSLSLSLSSIAVPGNPLISYDSGRLIVKSKPMISDLINESFALMRKSLLLVDSQLDV